MPKIEIYTRPGCGYCTYAKRLLESKRLAFVEYDVYKKPEYMKQLQARTNGRIFPQVFIENIAIGGFAELLELKQSGQLLTQTHGIL